MTVAALETLANRALKLDPMSYQHLSDFADQVFHIECSQPQFDIYICPEQNFLRFASYYQGEVTTAIRGSATEFVKLATAKDPAGALINSNISLEGDSAPLIELQQLLSQLDLDWELPLVENLGDVAGHQLANVLGAVFSWGKRARQSTARQWKDYIQEEGLLAPSRQETEHFYRANSRLSQQLDRIEARFHRLQQRLGKLADHMTNNS